MTEQPPIVDQVNGSLVQGATWMTMRVCIVGLSGFAFAHFTQNAEVVQGGVAAVAMLLTYGYELYREIRNRRRMIKMAHAAPNAEVVRKPWFHL